jgi:DDE superfamily endonuclease
LTVTTSPSKKTLQAAGQDRPDVAAGRAALKAEQPKLRAPRLVFIDETAVTTKMVRRHGRSPRGERLVAGVPHGHWKTLTLVAALRIDGLTAPYVIDGAMDGPPFLAYVELVLAPTLRKADIVFMDNLRTTRSPAFARLSRLSAHACGICRPTRPTSILSSRPSPG